MSEQWRPVLGFEDYYEVSDQGRVKSLSRERTNGNGSYIQKERILQPQHDGRSRGGIGAHVKVCLSVGGVVTQRSVHILVLEAFVGPRPAGHETRHLNGIPDDNRLVNLCWGTPAENRADTIRHGTLPRGSARFNAILRESDIPKIRAGLAAGQSQYALARAFGVGRGAINMIHRRRSWAHV